MDPDKMSDRELRNEVKISRLLLDVRNPMLEYIFTVTGRVKSPQMCYREDFPHTPMDRWVRCHLLDGRVVLGPPK